FDTPGVITPEQSDELYSMVKQYQPDCLVNSRIGNGRGDYGSAGDNEIPEDDKGAMLFETPATLNDTWGYKSFDNNWKDAKTVKQIKNHLNERGINYLLNVGPDYLGRIPGPAVDILREVGRD
ncbi:MAG: alpha-L-fucosidase, partial [Clostridia bacterium]|nr:alpha-L-fucosidase [Clostridia bacterium]